MSGADETAFAAMRQLEADLNDALSGLELLASIGERLPAAERGPIRWLTTKLREDLEDIGERLTVLRLDGSPSGEADAAAVAGVA